MAGGHSHTHDSSAYDNSDAVRAVIVSAVALAIASATEFATGLAGHSAGVTADALHNAGDVLTTGVLLISFRLARRPATARFTAGFGRIEDVATLVIIVVIVVTAAAAAFESIRRLLVSEPYGNVPLAMVAAGVGIVANLGVSEYKIRVGRGIRSTALEADGMHSRIDALVSAGALVGIALSGLAGIPLADPIAGILITLAILYILGGTVKELFYRMMDAVDPDYVDKIEHAAEHVDGVLGVHDISARWVGRELQVVIHIDCDPEATLQEAHTLAQEVEHQIQHHAPVARIDVHMDPGTDPHRH
jgi:cation diffusion facilitator family transporter